MFWLRNKNNNFQLCTLIWGPVTDNLARIIASHVHNVWKNMKAKTFKEIMQNCNFKVNNCC